MKVGPNVGVKVDWDFWISDLVKNPDGTDIYPVVNFGEVQRAQLPNPFFSPLHWCPWSVQMLKREWGVESNRKLLHLFITSKTATLVPEFAVEYLPLGRTAALVPEFAVKDLPLGRTL